HWRSLRAREMARRLSEAVAEHAEELPEQLHRKLVLLAQDGEEVGAADGDELALLDRGNRRRSGHAPDERHLAEVLARADLGEHLLAAQDLEEPLHDDEELIAAL